MAIQLNDNIYIRAGKPIDYKYGPYLSINEANSSIPIEERYHGLAFGVYENPTDILNSDILIYYYYGNLTDNENRLFVNYVHPSYNNFNLTLSGSTVIESIVTDNIGSVVSVGLRNLTASDINLNDGVLTLNTTGIGLTGSQTFSANQSNNVTFTVTSNATPNNSILTLVSRDALGNFTANRITASLLGNSSSATILENTRTINGTNFNGSQDIVTLHWGISRNITIGNTSKSVNGSENVSWSLSEIGAQPQDDDLFAISALNGTGFLKRVGVNSWLLDSNTYLTQNQNITLNGDVTGSGNTNINTTISNKAVNYSKIQDVTANNLLGRLNTNGTIQELSDIDVRTFLNVENGANNYIHPSYTVKNLSLTGATVINNFESDSIGSIVNITTRTLTTDDINAVPKSRIISISGTINQVLVTTPNSQDLSSDRNWIISLPQDIHTSATPTFGDLTINGNIGIRATATGSIATQIPVFTSNPELNTRVLVTRTPSELLNDMGGLAVSGGTMNGFITLHSDPIEPLHAATKQYVDSVAEGLHVHPSVKVATTNSLSNLSGGSVIYDNGINGVGSTLSLSNPLVTIDGYTLIDGDRVLIKNETNKAYNGLYVRTSPTLFTRADDQNSATEIQSGDFVFVSNGNTYSNTGWVQIFPVNIVGSDPIDWEQFSGQGTYIGSTSIILNDNSFQRAALIGDVTALQNSNTLTILNNAVTNTKFRQSDGLSIVGRAIDTTGNVADIIATTDNQVLRRFGNSIGFGSINLGSSNAVSGVLPIVNGGTNSSTSLNNNRIMISSVGSIIEASAITSNRALISNSNGIPTHSNVTNTELSYLSGVTSSIQTQINNKQNTLVNPITGTGTVNFISKFSGNTNLTDTNIVVINNKVGINQLNPEYNLDIVGNTKITSQILGSNILNINGVSGELLNIYDENIGPLFELNDTNTGLPIFEVNHDGFIYTNSNNLRNITGTTTVYEFNKNNFDGVYFDYYVTENNTRAKRIGIIMGTWDNINNNITFTDTSTDDINGSTTGINFDLIISDQNIKLNTFISSGNWNIKITTRLI